MLKNLRVVHIVIFKLLLLLFLTGCQEQPQDIDIPKFLTQLEIASFHEAYPNLYTKAKEWDTSVGLTKGFVYIIPKADLNSRRVGAIFNSPNKDAQFVFVEQLNTEITFSREGEYPLALRKYDFIEPSKILDSVAAWNIFLSYPEVLSYSAKDFECAQMILLSGTYNAHKTIVWRLLVSECDPLEYDYFHIDAKTGERLD